MISNKRKSSLLISKNNWIWNKSKKSKSLYQLDNNDNQYLVEFKDLEKSINNWNNFFIDDDTNNDEKRNISWIRLEVIGQALCKKYSWAIPNKKAIDIIAHFGPLIEIGCGKGYWAYLLRKKGVDIIAVDKIIQKNSWTNVIKGNSKYLLSNEAINRNLFLCYPDESESLGIKCLNNFQGEYIIHVGEMITTGGTLSGKPQSPFGRTTSADFQIQLAESFHCILITSIPRYPFSNDTLSVWKRTKFVKGREDYPNDSDDGNDDDDIDSENEWATIPEDEILQLIELHHV